jgi:hypothetical protein
MVIMKTGESEQKGASQALFCPLDKQPRISLNAGGTTNDEFARNR